MCSRHLQILGCVFFFDPHRSQFDPIHPVFIERMYASVKRSQPSCDYPLRGIFFLSLSFIS
jgi:hypothetical protein